METLSRGPKGPDRQRSRVGPITVALARSALVMGAGVVAPGGCGESQSLIGVPGEAPSGSLQLQAKTLSIPVSPTATIFTPRARALFRCKIDITECFARSDRLASDALAKVAAGPWQNDVGAVTEQSGKYLARAVSAPATSTVDGCSVKQPVYDCEPSGSVPIRRASEAVECTFYARSSKAKYGPVLDAAAASDRRPVQLPVEPRETIRTGTVRVALEAIEYFLVPRSSNRENDAARSISPLAGLAAAKKRSAIEHAERSDKAIGYGSIRNILESMQHRFLTRWRHSEDGPGPSVSHCELVPPP